MSSRRTPQIHIMLKKSRCWIETFRTANTTTTPRKQEGSVRFQSTAARICWYHVRIWSTPSGGGVRQPGSTPSRSPARRGKGYGRVLMEETELYAKRRGFKRLCLTTHDKQHFYAHLGYVLSTPVQSTSTVMALLPMGMLMRLSRAPDAKANPMKQTPTRMEDLERSCADGSPSPSCLNNPLPSVPPPPPPLP
ncbi:N-alpha-acetyltransferase 80-like [Gambusia affinis]|uniref:N-alpha-acetyltransferase 80-like n=1 Tax=Gambusia affinis TaxID=33528 RepID=UPI001CDC53D3|nr:N-alpha-acetyltransferase 80-like [Gambusia affinis]XP_043974170.1 N-alpha-acetyltransferase 80-like [Gambusia affinis]